MKFFRGIDRHGFSAALAWALCSALYLWTANGVVIRDADRNNAWHHYEYMVDGFLSGHLYLSLPPPKELLALPDPYDPVQNIRYRLWDVSLYQGKYYLYYGPTPALLLMLPWKAITGQHLPQRLAAGVFAVAGLAAVALLLSALRRKYFPTASPTLLFFAVALAGHVSWLPVILRRPAFWELPIVTAAALFWWSLYCLWRYHDAGGRKRWGVAAGIALAFALGARPTYLFTAGFVALLFALPIERTLAFRVYVRRLLPVVAPLAVGCAALLAYNYLRFGQLFEFGQRYQLWGMDEREVRHFSVTYFPFNLWLYFFSFPELSPYFPFFRTVWPADLPPGYIATEEMPGSLFMLPALLPGFFALLHISRHRDNPAERPLRCLVLAGVGASLLSALILFCFAGACSRYLAELMAGWTVVAAIGFLAAFAGGDQPSGSGWLRWSTAIAAIWTGLYVWLASLEFRGFARVTQPGFYRPVATVMNYPSYWIAQKDGQQFGPVAIDVRLSDSTNSESIVLLAAGRPGMLNQLFLDRPAPGKLRLRLMANEIHILETPVFEQSGPTFHFICEAPWLCPPAAHPYWESVYSDPGRRARAQDSFALTVDGVRYEQHSIWIFDATRFEPFVRDANSRPAEWAWVEKITRMRESHGEP